MVSVGTAHPADQGHGRKADEQRADGGNNDDRPAFERRNHILLRRHGNDDGDIKRAPETDA